MARTYLSGLVAVVHAVCKYITKYGPIILPQLDDNEKLVLQAVITACNAFMGSSIVTQAKND